MNCVRRCDVTEGVTPIQLQATTWSPTHYMRCCIHVVLTLCSHRVVALWHVRSNDCASTRAKLRNCYRSPRFGAAAAFTYYSFHQSYTLIAGRACILSPLVFRSIPALVPNTSIAFHHCHLFPIHNVAQRFSSCSKGRSPLSFRPFRFSPHISSLPPLHSSLQPSSSSPLPTLSSSPTSPARLLLPFPSFRPSSFSFFFSSYSSYLLSTFLSLPYRLIPVSHVLFPIFLYFSIKYPHPHPHPHPHPNPNLRPDPYLNLILSLILLSPTMKSLHPITASVMSPRFPCTAPPGPAPPHSPPSPSIPPLPTRLRPAHSSSHPSPVAPFLTHSLMPPLRARPFPSLPSPPPLPIHPLLATPPLIRHRLVHSMCERPR